MKCFAAWNVKVTEDSASNLCGAMLVPSSDARESLAFKPVKLNQPSINVIFNHESCYTCSVFVCTSQSLHFTTFGCDDKQCSLLDSVVLFISCTYILKFSYPLHCIPSWGFFLEKLDQASEANSEPSLSLSHVEGIVAQALPALRICDYLCTALRKIMKNMKTWQDHEGMKVAKALRLRPRTHA